jgi:homoserine acetyltransferase
MIIQDGQFDAALSYCDQEGLDMSESRKRLEQELLDGNMEDMVARLHPRTAYEKTLLARAEKFCAEYQLATWVEARNEGEGVAPAYQHVFSHMKQVQPVTVTAASRSRLLKYRSQIQWVRRFRHRWNGKHTSIKSQRGHNEEELRNQAESINRFMFFFDFWNQKTGPVFGPQKWAQFWALGIKF